MIAAQSEIDARSWALLLALALLWSASFIFIKVAGAEIPVFTLVLARVGLAALVLHAVVIASARRYPTEARDLSRYALMGLVNNVLPFALIVYATPRTGAGAASILNATAPIFALIVAHFATADEKLTARKLAGILLGAGGVVAMIGPQALAGLGSQLTPAAAMLLASFFYGVAAVLGRGFRGQDPTVSATCQLTASTLMLAPVALILDRPWNLPMPSALVTASAVALAVLSTALAYVLFYALIRRAGGTNTILVTLLIPAGGVFLGWALLSESFTAGDATGMALIGAGLVVIDGRVAVRLRIPPSSRR